ncbi:MAG: glycosyltransferase family A protein [Bacteroidota bacterium]
MQNHSSDKKPLVTIGIPTYKGSENIPLAIESLMKQDYQNLEILISDNCSPDNTEEVCRALAEKYPQIRYVRQENNLGAIPNFNYVLHHAKGKYFMWLSDDDWLQENIVSTYVDFLENNQDYALVSGKILYWEGEEITYCEEALSFEEEKGIERAAKYYAIWKQGAIVYGLMRTDWAQKSELPIALGNDWHFIADIAYMGKIKQLEVVGYNKAQGGLSDNYHNYAKKMNEHPIWGYMPYTKIALDAFKRIGGREPLYKGDPWSKRIGGGMKAASGIWWRYIFPYYPRMIKRNLTRILAAK